MSETCWCGVPAAVTHAHPASGVGAGIPIGEAPCPAWEDGQHFFESSMFVNGVTHRFENKRCVCGRTIWRTKP